MLTESFMIWAFLVALFLCPLCSLLGVFVTSRRMSFFGETIAHGAIGGVAIGIFLGLANPTPAVVGFSFLIAAALLWLKENSELATDTIMALLLSGSISFGMLLLSLMKGNFSGDIHRILFGDILAVGPQDVIIAAALLIVISVLIFTRLSQLTLLSAQEELAHVCGVRVRRLNYLFVLALTLTVAISVRLVGILLVTPMLVIPAASARNISVNLRQQIIFSLVIGIVGGLAGVAVAYHLDAPCGPAIVMTCVGIFIITLIARPLALNSKPAK
ncbi:MAG: metal ABC transporter permease [Verrucomicrobiia bacterium]|jgi:zinc transport system permease protein